jgi:hypothetical protein
MTTLASGSNGQRRGTGRAGTTRRRTAGAGRSRSSSRGLPAEEAARWTLAQGAAEAESPIGRYAAALASAVLDDWEPVRVLADGLRVGEGFPHDVADALALLAAEDVIGYTEAVESVLESFETRDEYLENVAVADTVLVLQALARTRAIEVELTSPLLPGTT